MANLGGSFGNITQPGFNSLQKTIPNEDFNRLSILYKNTVAGFNALTKELINNKATPEKCNIKIKDLQNEIDGLNKQIKNCTEKLKISTSELSEKDRQIKEIEIRTNKEIEESKKNIGKPDIIYQNSVREILRLYGPNQLSKIIDENELMQFIQNYVNNKIGSLYFPMLSMALNEELYKELLNSVVRQIIFEVTENLNSQIDIFKALNRVIPNVIRDYNEYDQNIRKNIQILDNVINKIKNPDPMLIRKYGYRNLYNDENTYELTRVAANFINRLLKMDKNTRSFVNTYIGSDRDLRDIYGLISLFPFIDKNSLEEIFGRDFRNKFQKAIEESLKDNKLPINTITNYEDLMKYAIPPDF